MIGTWLLFHMVILVPWTVSIWWMAKITIEQWFFVHAFFFYYVQTLWILVDTESYLLFFHMRRFNLNLCYFKRFFFQNTTCLPDKFADFNFQINISVWSILELIEHQMVLFDIFFIHFIKISLINGKLSDTRPM